MDDVHKIFYDDEGSRKYWECQTCSSSGSGPDDFRYDPEEHAETVHKERGITMLSTTNKRSKE